MNQAPPAPAPAPVQYTYGPIHELGVFNATVPSWGAMHALIWFTRRLGTLPPAAHLIGAALPLLAHEAARRGWRLGRSRELPRLQTALVGGPGTGKGSSIRMVREFYCDHLRTVMASGYADPWIQIEGSIPGILEQLSLRHNARADQTNAILFHEEFTAVLEKKDAVAETLNQVFDGITITRYLRSYTKQQEETGFAPNEVRNPAVSAVFATTHSGIETATTKRQASGGFFSRLLWFTGDPGYITFDDDPQLAARTSALGVWDGWSRHLDAVEHSGEAKVLDLAPQCKALFEEMVGEVNAALRSNAEDPNNAIRLRGLRQARIIAMLYGFSRGERFAALEDAERALALVRATQGMTEVLSRTWTIAAEQGTSEALIVHKAQDVIYSKIEAAGISGLRKSELFKVVPIKSQLDQVLAHLLDKELIDECRVHNGGKGRPATVYKARAITAEQGAKVLQFIAKPPVDDK